MHLSMSSQSRTTRICHPISVRPISSSGMRVRFRMVGTISISRIVARSILSPPSRRLACSELYAINGCSKKQEERGSVFHAYQTRRLRSFATPHFRVSWRLSIPAFTIARLQSKRALRHTWSATSHSLSGSSERVRHELCCASPPKRRRRVPGGTGHWPVAAGVEGESPSFILLSGLAGLEFPDSNPRSATVREAPVAALRLVCDTAALHQIRKLPLDSGACASPSLAATLGPTPTTNHFPHAPPPHSPP
jgi:hypothetical protein